VLVFHCYDKIPEKNNLKEDRLILAHGFRGLSRCRLIPLLWVCGEAEHHDGEGRVKGVGVQRCSPHGGQETRETEKQGPDTKYTLQKHSYGLGISLVIDLHSMCV
jgi:hypothetical protein